MRTISFWQFYFTPDFFNLGLAFHRQVSNNLLTNFLFLPFFRLWNREKDILMVREMANKGIFESKCESWKRGSIWQNIADNLNNCEKLAVLTWRLGDHFINLTKKYKSITKQEVTGIGLGCEDLSENEQILENLIMRLEKSERRTEVNTQERKLKKWKKSNGKIWRDKKT